MSGSQLGKQLLDYSTLLTEAKDKLKLLNNLYFKSSENATTLCKNEPVLGGNFASISSNSNIDMLLDLRNNDASLNTGVSSFIKTISYDSANAPYISLYTPSIAEGISSDYISYRLTTDTSKFITNTNYAGLSEINCLTLLDYADNHFHTNNVLKETESSNYPIYTFMQGLYTLYSLFEAKTWEAYKDNIKNQTPNSLSIYIPTIVKISSITTLTTSEEKNAIHITETNLEKYAAYVSSSILNTILESSTFNAFIARRLIYLWITLCNYLIATVYLKNASTIPNGFDFVTPLIKGIYNLFVQINNNVKYNSIEDVGNTDDDENFNSNQDEIGLEKTQLKAEIFKTCVNYINSENPQSRYDYLFGTNGDAKTPLNEYYDVVLKSPNKIGTDKYPKLKADANNPSTGLSYKNEILKGNDDSVYNKLNTLTFSITPPNTFLSTLTKDRTKTNEAQITFINQSYINSMHTSAKALRMTSSSTGVFGDINNAIGNYIGRYATSQTNITDISSLLSKGKANLITIQNLLSGRLSIQKKQRIIEYIAIFIFAVFVITAISLLVIKVEKKTKLYSCIGLVLFSLIHFLGIQVLLNSSIFIIQGNSSPVVESFKIDVVRSAKDIAINTNRDTYLQYYNIGIINQVNVYLENTFTLVTLLETYKAYGNLNASLDKELAYYTNIVSQLNNAQSKVNKVYFSSYMNTIDISALLHMFQILSIIVAAACTVYIITEEMPDPSIKKWIAGVSFTLAIITFIIYILEIKKHVHTNPVKIYWSNPGVNTFY